QTGTAGITPDPSEATRDIPVAYGNGCHQDQVDSTAIMCEYGDLDSEMDIVVVGDSKILQYQSPLTRIAEEEGWHVHSFTKSACGFHDGMQVRKGQPYTSCAEWNQNVLAAVIDLDPDLVITSQGAPTALSDITDPSTLDPETMVQAIASRWQELDDAGIPVAAIVDNPRPPVTVHECVVEHSDDLTACSFDQADGESQSGGLAQAAAAGLVDNVTLIDLIDLVCPDGVCVPVIDDVLVYRTGSHLTDTYALSLTEPLRERLVPVVQGLR
ncbi:SGNH hydrolase domain-containing protein, partial [Nocardioides sp. AE5]|uniref:SGNH hydrolase domain-containing protein n=1 Tax=Nocardioides sp. AE5 TaxID=2962573 RepID=UPI002882D36C